MNFFNILGFSGDPGSSPSIFLVLILSQFTPTVEFGMLSVITIVTALIGDLTFLPALLSQIKPKIKN